MRKIFLVCYGGGHAKMLVPLIKRLGVDKKFDVIVLALTTAASVMEANGISFITMRSLTHLCTNEQWRIFGEMLVSKADLSPLVSYDESVAYHGINYAELVDLHGASVAKDLYACDGRQAFYPVQFFQKILSLYKPDLVVSTNSPRSERACIQAAREVGIKSICLVDMFAFHEVKWISENDFADRICVLNEHVRDFFVSHGRRKSDLVVTGNPAFDSVNSQDVLQAAAGLIRESDIYSKSYVILYASQPEPEIHPFSHVLGNSNLPREIENVLREYVRARDYCHLVIRYHPSENVTFHSSENVTFSPKGEPLHPLLHIADLVVVTASTVGLEAHLAGTNVISVDCSIFTSDAPFSEMGISTGVSSPEFLCRAIDDFFTNYTKSDALSLKVSSFNATAKVMGVIVDMFS